MKKISTVILVGLLAVSSLSGCQSNSSGDDNHIVIWASGEDYKNEFYLTGLQEKFPEYTFELEYMNSSTIAAKVLAEGENCECDIICSNEYGYLEMCGEYLADMSTFDYSLFLDEIVPESKKYTPECKNGGCIIINTEVLNERGLDVPESYDDLLDPQYKGLISMPSPSSSGTGYMFLRQLTNEWGEDEAFAYFEKLTENILQYTSSGSGPVNALVQGEVAIGLGMTSQAVVEKNEGAPLEILFFEEGSPYSMYGYAMLADSAERECVANAYSYLAIDLCRGNNETYFPDQIFKDSTVQIDGFPTDVKYGNMVNDTLSEKERLVEKWIFS